MNTLPPTPAYRLYDAIATIRQAPDDSIVQDVIAEHFRLSVEDDRLCLAAIGLLHRLPLIIANDVYRKRLNGPEDLLTWSPFAVRGLSALGIRTRVKSAQQVFDKGEWGLLKVCGNLLSANTPLSADSLGSAKETESLDKAAASLQDEVLALVDRVTEDPHVPNDLREWLVRQLIRIEATIMDYRVHGAEALRDSLTSALVILHMERENLRALRDRPSLRDYVSCIGNATQLLLVAFRVIAGDPSAPPLLDWVADMLPALEGVDSESGTDTATKPHDSTPQP